MWENMNFQGYAAPSILFRLALPKGTSHNHQNTFPVWKYVSQIGRLSAFVDVTSDAYVKPQFCSLKPSTIRPPPYWGKKWMNYKRI